MNLQFSDVVATLSFIFSGTSGIAVYLFKKSYEKKINKDLEVHKHQLGLISEKHRAELQRIAYQNQIKIDIINKVYPELHLLLEDLAKVLRDYYHLEFSDSTISLDNAMEWGKRVGKSDEDIAYTIATLQYGHDQAYRKYIVKSHNEIIKRSSPLFQQILDFIGKNRLYLDDTIIMKITDLHTKLDEFQQVFLKQGLPSVQGEELKDIGLLFGEIRLMIKKEVLGNELT